MKLFGTAVVLAGGKSSRMGFDKSFIEVKGKPLIKILIEELNKEFHEIIVVTNSPEEYRQLDVLITPDILKGVGPLGGIHAGLKASSSRYIFLMACDMPMLSLEYARYMIQVAAEKLPDAVISCNGEWIEPFHALYSVDIADDIEKNVKMGRYKIYDVLKKKNVLRISESDVRRYSPGLEIFRNLNDMGDLIEFYRYAEIEGEGYDIL
jgi:molybdopterin-guanine dinucleotide biosynthesis protein A